MKELSIIELAQQGGWIMIVLAIMSLIAIYIFTERFITIRNAGKDDPLFMARIRDYIKSNDLASAINFCRITNTPAARIIERGISRMGKPVADIQSAIENTGNIEVSLLEKRLPILSTISGGAPMIGFLGTVAGMIEAFFQMSNAGNNIDVSSLAGGIYTAMVTTLGGLFVGIIAYFAYNYLTTLVDKVVRDMEARSLEFMDILNEPAN